MNENVKAVSDEALAAALARRPDDKLFGELFQRYYKRIYLWSFSYTHDAEEAVELTQEILIKLFRGIGSFAGLARFSTWAYQVTRNHCLGELSKRGAQWRERLHLVEDGKDEEQSAGEFSRAVDEMGAAERIIEAARDHLEADELKAFILRYREGLTVKEITKLLGLSNAAGARTLIQNARRKFGRLVEEKDFSNVS